MDPRINLKFRKPRRAKGTPAHLYSHLVATGGIIFAGVFWYFYENYYPPAIKVKRLIHEGKLFHRTEEEKRIRQQVQIALSDPTTDSVLRQVRFKERKREILDELEREKARPQPWYLKIFSSSSKQDHVPKISTFFNKVKDDNNQSNSSENEIISSVDFESPYKNCVSGKNSVNVDNDDSDFAKCKPTFPRLSNLQPVNSIKTRKNKKKTQSNTLVKMTQKKMKEVADDVNLEHLQMAIALSKSVEDDNSHSIYSLSTSQEKPSLKSVLEQFGFRSGSSKGISKKSNGSDFKIRNKKSKFRYITPTLLLRTTEERDSLISSKISLILNQNHIKNVDKDNSIIYSEFLKQFNAEHSVIFQTSDKYYVDQLKLSPNTQKCGHLLKDWSKIPGREVSPQKNPRTTSKVDDTITKSSFESRTECISPDLFESSFGTPEKTPPQSPNRCLSQSLINLSPNKSNSLIKSPDFEDIQLSYSNKSGINHYESFTNDNSIVCDLTQSSDEDQETEKDLMLSSKKNLFDAFEKSSKGVSFSMDVDADSIGDLNVTEYVNNLLTCDRDLSKADDNDGNSSSIKNSQESIVISDEELNYSSIYATPGKRKQSKCKTVTYEISDDEEVEKNPPVLETTSKPSTSTSLLNCFDDSLKSLLEKNSILDQIEKIETKQTSDLNENAVNVTPKTNVTIKTKNVTPAMDYDKMDTPKIVNELNRFGLKPMKRQRGVKLLKYIYETTHPVINLEENSDNEEERAVKRTKTNENVVENVQLMGDAILEGENMNDLIFERKQSARIHSCRIPLQIVWHNFVQNNPDIYENILTYEPLQLEVLHAMLKEQGYKFNVQDLLSFLDKKCITIRTNQKNK